MPQGDKSSYTDKQKRQPAHIEAGYEKKGLSTKTADSTGLGHRKQTHRRRQTERLRPEEKPGGSMPSLTTKQVRLHLKAVPNWSKRAQTILRTFKFDGFPKSIEFVNRVARKAQKVDHHPDTDIRFNKVTLTLTTHDEGGITEKDFSLARQCDEVLSRFFAS